MNQREWAANIRSVVARIADEGYQRRSWLGGGPEVSSPIELYSQLMEDWMLGQFILRNGGNMSERQRAASFGLATAMEALVIDSESDPRVVLEDPNWRIAQEAAAAFLSAFPPEQDDIVAAPQDSSRGARGRR